MDGILVVYKPVGMTSRDVVNKVSKILGTKKVGHTGTLDPLASGILILCIGKATKLVELLTATEKEYRAEVTLGIQTDTLDITGTILERKNFDITENQILEVLDSMIGTYEQEVPLYSAIHVDGKKLYEYARENKDVKLPTKAVTIFSLNLISMEDENHFSFDTKVSKGTYIRSLIRDITLRLGTVGTMSKLERIRQGSFELKNSFTLNQIEEGHYSILPIMEVLKNYPSVIVDKEMEKKIKNGQLLKNKYHYSEILFLNVENKPLALYHTYEKDDCYLKPWKMLL